MAQRLLRKYAGQVGDKLVDGLLSPDHYSESGIEQQRRLVEELKGKIKDIDEPDARRLFRRAD